MPYPLETLSLRDHRGGINNKDDARFIPLSQSQICKNLVLLGRGALKTRPGSTQVEDNTPGGVTSQAPRLYDFNGSLYYTHSNDLYRRVVGGADVLVESTIVSADSDSGRAVVARGRLYFSDYTNPPKRVDADDNAATAGLRVPRLSDLAGIPVATGYATGGNVENGTYHYRASYGYGTNDEIGISHHTAPTSDLQWTCVHAAGTGHIDSSNFPTSGALAATAGAPTSMHVWRTLANDLNVGIYYYVGEYDPTAAPTFRDEASDFELQEAHDKFEEGLPPQGRYIAYWRDRIWMTTTTTGELRFSDDFEIDFWPSENVLSIEEAILALHAEGEYLYVFTNKRVLAITGRDVNDFSLQVVAPNLGIQTNESYVSVGGAVWVLSSQLEFHEIRAVNAQKILRDYTPSGPARMMYVETPLVRPSVWVHANLTPPGNETTTHLIDIETRSVRTIEPFADDDHEHCAYTAPNKTLFAEADGTTSVYAGEGLPDNSVKIFSAFDDTPTDAFIERFTPWAANARGFECYLRTSEIDFGSPLEEKLLLQVEVVFDQEITTKAGTTNEVRVYVNGSYVAAQATYSIQDGDRRIVFHGVDHGSVTTLGKTFTIDVQFTDETNRITIEEIICRYRRLPLRYE